MAKDDECQQKINEFEEEIKLMKQSKKQQDDPKKERCRNNIILE